MALSEHVSKQKHTLTQDTKQKSGSWRHAGGHLSGVDLLGMLFGLLLCQSISYIFARGRIFWEDELLGWMLLRDPSWRHMIAAWKLGADGGGFAFYLTARTWLHLFGPSEISLRMYSATCLGLAFVVAWAAARRYYRFGIVAFAMFNTWFFSPPIVIHMAEGRFYGLLLLSTTFVVWFTVGPAQRPDRTPLWLYPLAFVCHALLTTSHLLGAVYSFFLLCALIVLDLLAARIRPALYTCGAAAWLLLIPERTAILASAHVGKPHFWTVRPTLFNFLGPYTAFSGEVAAILALLALALVLTLRQTPGSWRSTIMAAFRLRRPIWIVTAALLLIPVAYVVEGLVGPSLFVNRYLLPVTLAQIFLTAEAVTLVNWHRFVPRMLRDRPWVWPVATTLFAIAILAWIFGHVRLFVIPPKNYTDALNQLLPKNIPVVCEDAWTFSEVIAREHDRGVEYTYLLDWPESISPDAPLLEVTQYHLMENWRKAGYFSGSIVDRDAFLKDHNRFLVLRVEPNPRPAGPLGYGNPLVDRFQQTPGYEVRPYTVLNREHIRNIAWLVCRGGCATSGR